MRSYVASTLAAALPDTPTHWANQLFAQPDGLFLSVSMNDGESLRANLGAQFTVRHVGRLEVTVFVPQDTGTRALYLAGETVGRTFQELGANLPDSARLLFRTPSYSDGGTVGGFYTLVVRIPYLRDER
ncbi:phage tail terminator-like protein [Rhodoligotrophos appendicifer]|uniref:phage tail terminator-like protein n=1 Tax=Rhodoligotrophos appendicifer TaxID=987056 RepID=UPI0014787D77